MSRRILYTITLAETGGAQSHVLDLIRLLSPDNDVALAAGTEGSLTEAARELGCEVFIVSALTRSVRPFNEWLAVLQMRSVIRTFRPDVVHAHSSKAGLVTRLAGRREAVPVMFTAHGWVFAPGAPAMTRFVSWFTEIIAARLGGTVVCISEFDRTLAKRHLLIPNDRLALVPHGLEPDAPRADVTSTPPTIIMAARFQQQKDQPMLLRAIAQLPQDCRVLLAGSGPLLDECRQLAADLRLESQVEFLGNRSDIDDLLARSDIFVLFSRYEGLPISIMEAMRAGLPVVATDVCGVAEQVVDGSTGLLVEHDDVDAAAAALSNLIDSPLLRKKMGKAGRTKFMRDYTMDTMATRYELLYDRLASNERNSTTTEFPEEQAA